jgi:hypothetical protein
MFWVVKLHKMYLAFYLESPKFSKRCFVNDVVQIYFFCLIWPTPVDWFQSIQFKFTPVCDVLIKILNANML